MQTYNKLRIVGLVSALFSASMMAFHSAETILLKWVFFLLAIFFIRKAHIEEKKMRGDNPEEDKKRKRLAYIIVGILYGFVIVVFIVSRFLVKSS
jgi:small-conductance mechanosensitive channel